MSDDPKKALKEVAVRAVVNHFVGPKAAPLADAVMTVMGDDSSEVYQKGKDFLGNVMSGYWEKMGERPASHVYGRLTERRTAPSRFAPTMFRDEDPFFNPANPVKDEGTGKWLTPEGELAKSAIHRKDDKFLEGAGWRRAFYDNPEMTAEAIGATTAAAPLLAGGALLASIAAGNKPRSRYSYPVEPDRGGYDPEVNPNVEASKASNYYQNQILDKKHAHAKEIMALREQSRTPGVQDISQGAYGSGVTSGLSSANPFAKAMLSSFGDTRVSGLDENFGGASSYSPSLITLNSPALRMNTF